MHVVQICSLVSNTDNVDTYTEALAGGTLDLLFCE